MKLVRRICAKAQSQCAVDTAVVVRGMKVNDMRVMCSGKDKVYKTTCIKCDSDLEYIEDDVFNISEECKGGLRKTVSHWFKKDEHYVNIYVMKYRCIKCPVCGHVIKFVDFRDGLQTMETVRWEKIT